MRTEPLRHTAVVLCACLAGILRAAPPQETVWRKQEAPARLLVAPAGYRSHLLRVDLPPSVRDATRGVCAFDPAGTPLPASLIGLAEQPVAVELPVSRRLAAKGYTPRGKQKPLKLPIEVYLLPEPPQTQPPAGEERRPIHLSRGVQRLFTRPYVGRELVMFEARRRKDTYSVAIPEFGEALPYEKWANPPESLTAHIHWATEYRAQETATLRFGANQNAVAWFLFLNGDFVAGWKQGEPLAGGGRMGEAVQVQPGFHRLDMFALQKSGEAVPRLLVQKPGQDPAPADPQDLFPVHHAPAVRLEKKEGVLQPGIHLKEVVRHLVVETGSEFVSFAVTPIAFQRSGRSITATTLTVGGNAPADLDRDRWASPGRWLPDLLLTVTDELGYTERIGQPRRLVWGPVALVDADIELIEHTWMLAAGEDLEVRYRVTGPDESALEGLRGSLAVHTALLNLKGEAISETAAPAPGPGETARLSVALPRDTAVVKLSYRAFGKSDLARPLSLQIVRPTTTDGTIEGRGGRLLWNGSPAAFVADPMRGPLPPVARKAEEPGGPRVVIADDFIATSSGPDAGVLPETWLMKSGFGQVRRVGTEAPTMAGTADELRKFVLLGGIEGQGTPVVVWAVGAADLRRGVKPPELCKQLLFLLQATRARGGSPLLVALPPLPGVAPALVRESALLTKELAMTTGTPVVDAYSRSILDRERIGRFPSLFASYDRRIGLPTPNNRGRVWLYRLIENSAGQGRTRTPAATGVGDNLQPQHRQTPAKSEPPITTDR